METLPGRGGDAIRIVYENNNLTSQFSTCAIYGGYAYGHCQSSSLRCMDVGTGKIMWDQPKVGQDVPLIIADGKIIAVIGKKFDTVIVAEASPDGYKELARWTIDGDIWDEAPKAGINPRPQLLSLRQ